MLETGDQDDMVKTDKTEQTDFLQVCKTCLLYVVSQPQEHDIDDSTSQLLDQGHASRSAKAQLHTGYEPLCVLHAIDRDA